MPQHPNTQTHLSWLRTRLSAERTLMSWARTATALIGFGFTIGKFLSQINKLAGSEQLRPPLVPSLPLQLGLTLIAVGFLSLGLACIQYRLLVRYLQSDEFAEISSAEGVPRFSPAFSTCVAITIVGVITFIVLLFRF
jgi:inner membrane protein YidH